MTDGSTSGHSQVRRLGSVGRFVSSVAERLQRSYLAGASTAAGDLAALRHAVGKSPGSVPGVWSIFEGVPLPDGYDADQPSRSEIAAFVALTLFATHQQSQAAQMHVPGFGFGHAVRRLSDGSASEQAVRRRFTAAGTADSVPELAHHARGLVTQFRSKGIPLDYGRFADDLLWFQFPDGPDKVRLRWGRDYYRQNKTDDQSTTNGGDVQHAHDH